MDKSEPLPIDWDKWRRVWDEYRRDLERRYGVRRGVDGDPFPGKNMLADELLGLWTVGQPGGEHPVELSEVTFPAFGKRWTGERVRYIGVTIDGVGLEGRSELAATLEELDQILGNLVHDRAMP